MESLKELFTVLEPKPEKMPECPVTLTEEQKTAILKEWNERPTNPPSIAELTRVVFPFANGRSPFAKLVARFLVSRDIKYPRISDIRAKTARPAPFTPEQKAYIEENMLKTSATKIARDLFQVKDAPPITAIGYHARAVKEYIESVSVESIEKKIDLDNPDNGAFWPPKGIHHAIARVNKYVRDALDPNKAKDSKNEHILRTFIKHCNQHRYNIIMQALKKDERIFFESHFVRYVWDKPDLTEEELDLYINLCDDILCHHRMKTEEAYLRESLENCNDDSEGKKISMSIVDALNNIRKNMNDNAKRQRDLIDILQGRRNDRIDLKTRENASFVNLLDYFKSKESRDRLVKLANQRRAAIKNEMVRLESMDELKAEIFGIAQEEL